MPTKLNREIVLQTLRGYEEVNRITEAERRLRLQRLSDEEALANFDRLCEGVVELNAEERQRLMPLRLEHHFRVREAFAKMARAKGHEPSL
jgi:hypothetical protein